EILPLRLEELEPLALLFMLLDCEHVDRAEPLDVRSDFVQLCGQLAMLTERRFRLRLQLRERATPLRLQPLANAALLRDRLRTPQLETMAHLAAIVERATQLAHPVLERHGRIRRLREPLIESAQLAA